MHTASLLDLLKAHINVAWLRPENALWDAIASSLVCKYEIVPPSLDLGCGNGIFSFITAGGDFSIDYDWYMNVDTEGFWENNKDIYDACRVENLDRFIIKKPRYTFSVGLDYKINLLKQAEALNFYQSIVEYDARQPLPFEDGQFKTVFSNILYWLTDLKKSLDQIYRILDRDGIAILCMPNTKFLHYCFTYHWKKENSGLLRLLNRGRSESMHWTISYKDFSILAKRVGFDIVDHFYYLSPIILKTWDIGLRPLSPLLINMANKLNLKDRKAVKLEWIETVTNFLLPLYEIEKNSKDEGGFHLFALKRKAQR